MMTEVCDWCVVQRSKGQVAISNRYQELRSVSVDSHTETGVGYMLQMIQVDWL